MKKPDWAVAKVKIYFATCWIDSLTSDLPTICGVNWFNDQLLMVCCFFHNYFVAPLMNEATGFPIRVLEEYEDETSDWSR